MEKSSFLNLIEIGNNGSLNMRFGYVEGESGIKWLRASIVPGGEANPFVSQVNAFFVDKGCPSISAEDVATINSALQSANARLT